MSLGIPWAPSIVFGWFASAAVWHGLSCHIGACGGLLGISGMKVRDVYAFVGLSSVVLGPSCLGVGGCCGAPLFSL